VNGTPGVLGWSASTLLGVLVPEIASDRVTGIRIVANPDKLHFVSEQVARLSHPGKPSGS
jgi:hypothetical protein